MFKLNKRVSLKNVSVGRGGGVGVGGLLGAEVGDGGKGERERERTLG